MLNLSGLRDSYSGKRCFIIGNGPSLNKTNLSLLKDEFTIGLNRIYLKFPDMGFETSMLCCVNELVLQQFGADIARLRMPKLVSDRVRGIIPDQGNIAFMRSVPGAGFNTDLSDYRWYTGATVTFCALQLAYHLGCKEVVLLGVDHNFDASGAAHQASRSKGADVNHFDPNYFGKNVVWQFPDLEDSEINYATAREVFRISGRSIVDGTVGGKLTVYPKVRGFAAEAADDLPPDDIVRLPQGEAVSNLGRIYELVLNGRMRSLLAPIGGSLVALGLAALIWYAVLNPGVLLPALAIAVTISGMGLMAVGLGANLLRDWARRRRLKDGQALLQILQLIAPRG